MENEFWELICAGVTQVEAVEVVGVSAATGQKWLRTTGGVRPRLVLVLRVDPQDRTRCLSEFEREHIALRWAAGAAMREIARELARDPSTISREIRRNGFTRSGYHRDSRPRGKWQYRGLLAHARAEERRRRPKVRKLARCPVLARVCRLAWRSCGARARSR